MAASVPSNFKLSHPVVFIAAATAFSLLGDQALYAILPTYFETLKSVFDEELSKGTGELTESRLKLVQKKARKRAISELVLVPSDNGCFEVTKGDTLVFSKLESGRFPEDGEIAAILDGQQAPVVSG